MYRLILTIFCLIPLADLSAQQPARALSQLATFGNMSEECCGDDDFSQTIFLAIPGTYEGDFFLRVFDPDCGGEYDMPTGHWETNTIFEVFGGEGCISALDARKTSPSGNYRSGIVLERQLFARESEVDGSWVTFGPFRASMGESLDTYPGYRFFKLIVEGRTGNDGNIYGLQVSRKPNAVAAIRKAVFFEYELTQLTDSRVLTKRVQGHTPDADEVELPVALEPIELPVNGVIIAEPLDH